MGFNRDFIYAPRMADGVARLSIFGRKEWNKRGGGVSVQNCSL
jgi:hypothetical protein